MRARNTVDVTSYTASLRLALPLRPLFVATIGLGSFLLFLIQPMFGRSVLPLLGGSPSVWNTAMLFYQVTLLLGYLYAHLVRRLSIARQMALHLALFSAAALTLPVGVARWVPAAGDTPPALWLLGLLAASIGPVFFVASAQSPLMQAWFGRSRHPDAANPYFLYAASNLGSFAALIAYPLLVEPTMTLGTQSLLWSLGFVLLAGLVAICGLSIRREAPVTVQDAPSVAVTWAQRRRWTLLAFVASGLLLSTTTHLTTDIAATPLLWVIPLGAYLLSFVLAFGASGPRWTRLAQQVAPGALLALAAWVCLRSGPGAATLFAAAGVLVLFIVALALHGTLAQEKPDVGGLTDFYLWISVGGALGGVLCALVAPIIFDWPYEHPLLLVVAAAVIPSPILSPRLAALWQDWRARLAVVMIASIIGVAAGLRIAALQPGALLPVGMQLELVGILLLWLLALATIGRSVLFAYVFAMLLLALGGAGQVRTSMTDGARERSFFGVYSIYTEPENNWRRLLHGTTTHGLQSLDPARSRLPMTYYAPDSGVGMVMRQAARFGDTARIAFVGLGAGTLACYARPGQSWTAYEIDPVVAAIARQQFSYIRQCRPDLPIVLGDARLTLQRAAPGALDILAVDAFSSDAIPLHLVTREAFGIYSRALQPEGVLLIHVSNKFLDLEPMIAAIGAAQGWTVKVRNYSPGGNQPRGQMFASSVWIALARTPGAMAAMTDRMPANAWTAPREQQGLVPWTDDFASILPMMKVFR
ncbi:MAG: spermidine synthase [Polymorphobacter sp.]